MRKCVHFKDSSKILFVQVFFFFIYNYDEVFLIFKINRLNIFKTRCNRNKGRKFVKDEKHGKVKMEPVAHGGGKLSYFIMIKFI